MRQVRKGSSGDGVQGGFPKEGMKEGPAKERKNFSEEEVAYLKKRRAELILEGKNDGQVARVLAKEMGRQVGSIREKIRVLVESGKLERNLNKRENRSFSEEDIACIKKRRAQLILEGKTDKQIAKLLSAVMGRSLSSIDEKIRVLVKGEELEGNPNKQEQCHFSEDDVAYIAKRRAGLILGGKKDFQIARVLAVELGRSVGSIEQKIRKLVESGELEENPKKQGGGISKEELAAGLSAAVDMYLGDSP